MKNQISITWYLDDIIDRDEELRDEGEDKITEDQARAVLEMLERKHDANHGINWEVIDFWIDQVKNEEFYK